MSESSRGTLLALLALASGPKHGYEISSWIEARSGGFYSLSFGALYPLLHRLEKDGLIAGSWEASGEARRRKVYSLTPAGQASLAAERARYEAGAEAMALLLGARS